MFGGIHSMVGTTEWINLAKWHKDVLFMCVHSVVFTILMSLYWPFFPGEKNQASHNNVMVLLKVQNF